MNGGRPRKSGKNPGRRMIPSAPGGITGAQNSLHNELDYIEGIAVMVNTITKSATVSMTPTTMM